MSEMRNKCPQCGRPLVLNETGRIGRCPHHQMWFPVAEGAVAEASLQNTNEAKEKEAKLRAEKEAKARAQQEAQKRQRASSTRKLLVVLIMLIAAAVVVFLFVIRPKMNYDSANAQFAEGAYRQAYDSYAELGDYKDSAERMAICGAVLSLQDNDISAAMAQIDGVISAGGEARNVMGDALLPVMQNWQASGVSPEGMLQLIARIGEIDPAGSLDAAQLTYEAHAGLLGDDVRLSMADDIDADGVDELVALSDGFQILAYDMQPDGNARISADAENTARCLVAFGDILMENSVDDALSCYLEAHRAVQDETTKTRVAMAYNTRAARDEAEGSVANALQDAKQAVEISGAAADFDFYYNMMLRSCTDEADYQAGIDRWDVFMQDEAALIQRFSAMEHSRIDAGNLRVRYASVLAVDHDPRCYELLHAGRELGADIEAALTEAIEKQTPGMLLAQLRTEAVALYAADPARQAEHQNAMAGEIITALQGWQSMGLSGEETLYLIRFADTHGVSLENLDVSAIYEAAAINASNAENASENIFMEGYHYGYADLLSITPEGEMQLYALYNEWTMACAYATGLANADLTVFECDMPLVLAVSGDKAAFEVAGYGDGTVSAIFREDGIINLSIQDNSLRFDRMLPGAIERRSQYSYTVDSAAARPVRTGIEWQEAAYPYPDSAEDTLRRWLEARCYDIPAEQALLTGDTAHAALGFDMDKMNALPAPDSAETIAVAAYDAEEGVVLMEAVYPASGKEVRAYFAVTLNDGKWQLAGAADGFSSAVAEYSADTSLPLLALNQAMTDRLEDKNDVNNYRVFLPQTSEVTLLWQAGTENKSRVAFTVSLLSAEDMTQTIISYDLALSASKQLSNPLFLAPGVYYISVAPGSYTDVPYTLTLQAVADPYVESEGNDTIASADPIEANQPYTGALKTAKDVDCYTVTLTEPGRLTVRIDAAPDGQKSARYNIAVADAATGTLLNGFQMMGNAESAQSCSLYVAPGAYVIQVSKGSHASAAAYEVTAGFEAMTACEQEMNAATESATQIGVNEAITGSFGVEGDKDYFRFTLEKDSIVQPRLSFTPLENNSRTYVLTIMKDQQALHSINIGGKENQKVVVPFALPAGSYVIELKNTNFSMQDYGLFVTAVEAAAAEHEFNDALATADTLAVGMSISGVIAHEEDTDYYKITLDEQRIVTLSFTFPASTVDGNVYALRLEQNDKSLWNMNVKGSSGGFSQQMQIPAGEYYLRIKPANWIGSVYNIELT